MSGNEIAPAATLSPAGGDGERAATPSPSAGGEGGGERASGATTHRDAVPGLKVVL